MAEFTISHPNVKKQQSYAQEGKQLIIEALTIDEEAKSTNDLSKRLKVGIILEQQGWLKPVLIVCFFNGEQKAF